MSGKWEVSVSEIALARRRKNNTNLIELWHSIFSCLFVAGKFRREFVSVLERCRCSNREIHRNHSCYFHNTGVRLNTISPNSRSMCHFVRHREGNKSFREKHVSNCQSMSMTVSLSLSFSID